MIPLRSMQSIVSQVTMMLVEVLEGDTLRGTPVGAAKINLHVYQEQCDYKILLAVAVLTFKVLDSRDVLLNALYRAIMETM